MRIGILIKDFELLGNWELTIIDKIIKDPSLELVLLIKDGRKSNDNPNNLNAKLKRLLKSRNVIGTILFKLQQKIESRLFKERLTVDKSKIISDLNIINKIEVKPFRKGYLDIFDKNCVKEIEKYNLDIILRHEFNIIRGELLNVPKYGIWSFHHGDNSINRGGPPGFWEIVLKQTSVGVTLQKLTPELDGGLVIDKAFYNRHWSVIKTSQDIFEGSVSILFKNIKNLQNKTFNPKSSELYFNPLYKAPNLGFVLRYSFNFYSTLIRKILQLINYQIFGTRYNCWTLFIGKGSFLDSTLYRLKPVKMPKNEFWADPFIFKHKDKDYIFFENYNYKSKKGKISCGRVNNSQLIDVVDVIEKEYHMSYPFIFKEDNNIFLIPETSENNRLEIYKCVDFPFNWELHSTVFEGEKIIDASIYICKNKNKWLFLNKPAGITAPDSSDLYIYKVNSDDFKELEPHKNNPVIINSKVARNGGAIFEYKNETYRPSQANIEGIYGRGLNINKIKKLTIDEYIEETIIMAKPNFDKGLIAMHHLHQSNDFFVIDAAYNKK